MPLSFDPNRYRRPVGTRLWHTGPDGNEVEGAHAAIFGCTDGLWGNCDILKGDATAKRGDLDVISKEGRRLSPWLHLWMGPESQPFAAPAKNLAEAA